MRNKFYDQKKIREKYSVFGGILGIICNLILFATKLIIGSLMNSIAIISDAFNNLSDMGSSFVVIIGSKYSNKKPDKEHPYGHGRTEYISSLIVSFIIMYVGIELFEASVDKIINPTEVEFSLFLTIILFCSLLVKLFMYFVFGAIGKEINSGMMKAFSKDSINDVISTSAVIFATIIDKFVPFKIDGIIGILVALYIIYSGFSIAKETVSVILGRKPSEELIESISIDILSRDGIYGIHDFILHDYGPNNIFASVHAEVSCEANITDIHEIIDKAEREISEKYSVMLVIHIDPILFCDTKTEEIRELVLSIIEVNNFLAEIHDFRICCYENRIDVFFDIVIAEESAKKQQEITNRIIDEATKIDKNLSFIITVDEYL